MIINKKRIVFQLRPILSVNTIFYKNSFMIRTLRQQLWSQNNRSIALTNA